MRERLLSSLYSALDKDPRGQIALRVQHPDGVAWQVADRVLTASTELGAPLAVIALHGITMAQLAQQLAAAGCQIVYQNPDLSHRAADALINGAGRQSKSNGDALLAFDSLLWSLLDANALELEASDAGVVAALRQLYLGSAEGEFVDVWGEYFGLPRANGETDEAYRARIVVETLRPRVTKVAIERAVKDVTGLDIELYEPWKDVFKLSASKLSDVQHMADGSYWLHNVVQPIAEYSIDWTVPLAMIERSRPAGTIIAAPMFHGRALIDASMKNAAVLVGPESVYSLTAHFNVSGRLDAFALGDETTEFVNYKASMAQLITMSNSDPLHNPPSFNETRRNMRRANIVLSDSDPLGDINAVFQRTYWIQPPEFMTLSDGQRLSDYVGRIELGMVDEILTLFAQSLSFEDFGGAKTYASQQDVRSYPVVATLSTAQPSMAVEAVHAEANEFGSVMAMDAQMWGFTGAGPWNQDNETGWENDTPWGSGINQS